MVINKKTFFAGLSLVLFAACLFAQTGTQNVLTTAHYELYAESGAESSLPSLAKELELRFEVYNQLFRFKNLAAPMKVRVFLDPSAYDSYVSARLGTTRPGAVYLHYNQTERRELLILRGSPEESSMLAHQIFIQYLRGFIPNPPSWMREGFAIYFNTLKYDPVTESLNYTENLAWLETVKSLGSQNLYPREIMMADTVAIHETAASGATAGRFSRDFQICSWALVSFFLFSGDYFRTLTESFMVLSPDLTAMENSMAVMDRFSLWTDMYQMDTDYFAYLDSRRTFAELMEAGRTYYNSGNAMNAEMVFMAALDIRPDNYAPYYYLGLIYYEDREYEMAEQFYQLSLEYGADEALVNYALGINAASAGRNFDAIVWLQKAAALDPERYGERAADLIRRLM